MEERLHLKGLNGLRGIAAISVVLSHLRIALPEFPALVHHPFDLADCGVTVFFTLSGFLITYLLVTEKQKSEISIRNFYFRRILRIWPLYFTYLALALLTIYIYSPEKLPGSLPFYLFFAANIPTILFNHLPYLSHYWTLGVEEQFYVFWPWLIKRSASPLKGIVIFMIGFILLKFIFRFTFFSWGYVIPLKILYINRFDCMAIGGITAMLCFQKNRLFFKISMHKITQFVCWLSLILMALNLFHITRLIDNDGVSIVASLLIVNLSFNQNSMINLENSFFDLLGKISYGIYIIHPLIIFYYSAFLNRFQFSAEWKIILVYGGVLILTVFFAWLSYEFFEKRFLKLKDRFSTVKSMSSEYV